VSKKWTIESVKRGRQAGDRGGYDAYGSIQSENGEEAGTDVDREGGSLERD
jgi:hypothetical protein